MLTPLPKKENLSEQTPDIIGCTIRYSRLKTVAALFKNLLFMAIDDIFPGVF